MQLVVTLASHDCSGVDDAHDRTGRHIPRCNIVAVVARVVPNLIHAPNIPDGGEDCPGGSIDHVLVRREGLTIMVRAAYKEVVAWPLNDAGRHAIRHHEAVDYDRPARPAAGVVADPGIDFVDAADVGDGNGIRICHQQVARVWIPRHPAHPGRRYGASAG